MRSVRFLYKKFIIFAIFPPQLGGIVRNKFEIFANSINQQTVAEILEKLKSFYIENPLILIVLLFNANEIVSNVNNRNVDLVNEQQQ